MLLDLEWFLKGFRLLKDAHTSTKSLWKTSQNTDVENKWKKITFENFVFVLKI